MTLRSDGEGRVMWCECVCVYTRNGGGLLWPGMASSTQSAPGTHDYAPMHPGYIALQTRPLVGGGVKE